MRHLIVKISIMQIQVFCEHKRNYIYKFRFIHIMTILQSFFFNYFQLILVNYYYFVYVKVKFVSNISFQLMFHLFSVKYKEELT